jgi:hypothetical protein
MDMASVLYGQANASLHGRGLPPRGSVVPAELFLCNTFITGTHRFLMRIAVCGLHAHCRLIAKLDLAG